MAITVNSDLTLTEADRAFVDLVDNRITSYKQIPYTVPPKLIIEIIKESARYFFRHDWRANQTKFYHIRLQDIQQYIGMVDLSKSDITDYTIKLPSYVQVVKELYEALTSTPPTTQEMIENIQFLQKSNYYGQSMVGINSNMYLLETACRMVEAQNWQSIMGTSVPSNFNPLTKELVIHKELKGGLIAELMVNVDLQVLYQNDLFLRHVIARCKQELKRVLGSHTIELPGGTLNVDEVCNNLEDSEKVEEMLKNSGGIGDIILAK